MRRIASLSMAAAAVIAFSTPAMAVDVNYSCTGADDVGLATAINDAGAGGSVTLTGDCVTTMAIIINSEVAIKGPAAPAAPSSAISCPTSVNASVTNSGAGAVFEVRQGASGASISGLAINAGTSHAIANGPLAGPFPLHQPDNVTISGNIITAGPGRCVSQFVHNGPPFNDTSACDAVGGVPFCAIPSGPGGPVGIATGWSISGNSCTTQNGTGIMVTGNDNHIGGNCINSGDECIRVQNNSCSSVPSVIAFGAAPGASNNHIVNNVCDNDFDAAEGGYPFFYIGLGFDFFTTEPELDACQRNFNTVIDGNCMTITEDTGNANFGACMQTQKENFLNFTNNDCTALIPQGGPPGGHAGVVNFDTINSDFSGNRMSGVDDFGILFLNATEVGNTVRDNQMSQGDIGAPVFPILITSGPNFVQGNEWCDGDALCIGCLGSVGTAGSFCAQAPGPPAASCAGQPELALANKPLSLPSFWAPMSRLDAGMRMQQHEMLDFVDAPQLAPNLTSPTQAPTQAPSVGTGGRSR